MADDTKAGAATEEVFEILEIGPDGKPLSKTGAETQAAAGAETQAGGAPADKLDDEDDDLEERVALSEEDRAARKEERKQRNDRRKELNRRRELELVELRRRNDEYEKRLINLEGGQSRVNVALLNDKLNIAEQQLRQADQVFTRAMADAAKNPAGVTEALRVRDAARDQHFQLSQVKARVDAAAGREQTTVQLRTEQPENAALPPAVRERVDAFQKKHAWYDLRGTDADHRVMQALDQEVADAGYDPSSQEYWDQLEKRATRYLPHRFKAPAAATNGARTGPPVAGSGEAAAKPGKTVIRVTPERRRAMEEAGAWDDPSKRNRMLKAYAKYDREHAS